MDVYAGGSRSEYGLWPLVLINSAIFIIFALSFTHPRTRRDWRSMGAFSAFVVALFTEMYGFPLTIYLLSGWLGSRYPAVDPLSHENGHLWQTLFGWSGDPHLNPVHLLGNALIVVGFIVIGEAWAVLHRAQRADRIATTGIYARVRHPQYLGFILVMIGFLVEWPTLVTLLMLPIMIRMYLGLARREEKAIRTELADAYDEYAASVPAFLPHLSRLRTRQPGLRGWRGTDRPSRFDGPPESTEVYAQEAATPTSTEP
ncbi:MAG: isoprenylcysteine carboxylmethyltransferase family protein [Thermoleophilia bacterium]|nr:isoprenylcysteine carboxylmethyltransferase family protein [Thermoleophilia bacterium]